MENFTSKEKTLARRSKVWKELRERTIKNWPMNPVGLRKKAGKRAVQVHHLIKAHNIKEYLNNPPLSVVGHHGHKLLENFCGNTREESIQMLTELKNQIQYCIDILEN